MKSRPLKILEEYTFIEASGQKMLLTRNQKRVAVERYERLSPQLPHCAVTEFEKLQTKYQAELAISAEIGQECDRLAKENIKVGEIRNRLHHEKLALLQECRRLRTRKWYQVIWDGLKGEQDGS